MTYMTSTASNAGVVDITVYFKQGIKILIWRLLMCRTVYRRRPDSFLLK